MKNFNLNVNGVIIVNYNDVIYRCSIQDVSEEQFSINVPVNNNEFLMIKKGEKLSFEYCTDTGNYYTFDSVILDRDVSDKIPMYKLSEPYNILRIQRRNYVRVPIVKELQYKVSEDDLWNKGIVLDLSGGGIKFKAKDCFKLNEDLLIKIETNSEVVEVSGKIIRHKEISINEHIYGLEFMDIHENKRDKIVQEVFLVMRKQRETI